MNRETETAVARVGGNRFDLVNAVTMRAHQLERGSPPRVISQSSKAVTVAIAEVARGQVALSDEPAAPTLAPAGRHGEYAEIRCSYCERIVKIRRRPGIAPQGRPPTKCAAHGLPSSWYEVAYAPMDI